MKVAYIMSRFPHLPETFILREMIALEAESVQIGLYPIILQREKVVHPVVQPWLKRARRSSLFSPALWLANFRLAFSDSKRYFGLLKHVLKEHKGNKKFTQRALVIFPKAVWMAELMRKEGIEHIHAHYATYPALAAYLIHQLTGIPYSVSVHAHDIYVDQTMLCEKINPASFIRSISEFNKKFLVKHCGSDISSKVQVIHCGINPKNYREMKNKRKGKFRILSIGSLQPYKGQEYLLKACALLKRRNFEFTCEVIGGGELYSSLEKMIHDLEIEDVVQLLGRKTEIDVAEYLYNAHCYVQPSIITETGKMEGIPVAIMEAMACKLPVIATRISGIPELIEDQRSGFLVPPEDEVALAERIFWVYENPEKARELGELGYKKVKKDFNLKKIAPQLKDLFTQNTDRLAGD
ncbi:MAG: glycosyltransferase [Pelolinea sp.]|nr:glycosyltransferase [Pelolinea sp.]